MPFRVVQTGEPALILRVADEPRFIGHQFFPTVGYRSAIRLLEQILDALLQRQNRDCPEEQFELTM